MTRFEIIALLVLAACAKPVPVPTTIAPAVRPPDATIDADPAVRCDPSCYPYRCDGTHCLTTCRTVDDCAHDSWPLACHGGACVPYNVDEHGHPYE